METRKSHKQYLKAILKSRRGPIVIFIIVLIFAVLVIAYSAWNAMSMARSSKEDARDYVSELTAQISNTINTELNGIKTTLSGIAESIEIFYSDHIDETASDEYIKNYLTSYMGNGQFEYLIFQRLTGNDIIVGTIPNEVSIKLNSSSEKLSSLDSVNTAIDRNKAVAYVEEGHIVFAMPLYIDGKLFGAVCGGTNSDNMHSMITAQVYRDQSDYCIINKDGKLLIDSDNYKFEQLRQIIEGDGASLDISSAELRNRISAGESDVIDVILDGSSYLLSYTPLSGENWRMLTLVPSDVFASIYAAYVHRALICAIGAAVIFLALVSFLVLNNFLASKKLEQLAFTDMLTKGINNTEFHQKYEKLKKKEDPLKYSIVFLDIKDFKLINESDGFSAGDRVLKFIYESINDELYATRYEFVARTEMDHFFVCLNENTERGIQQRIDDILNHINSSDPQLRTDFKVLFSQGACIVDDPNTDITVLQERARIAEKNQDYSSVNKCVIFTPDMEQKIIQDRNLDLLAEESIQHHDFSVYFQPKVSMSTGKIKGAEALVRWNHPSKGLISPGEFIPVLEKSGRIQKLDKYVFEEVCKWLSVREKAGKAMFPISVNLSRAHFWKESFLKEYVAIADKYHTNRDYVEFEITETVFTEDSKLQKIKEGIHQMHEYGFRCSVDDFGVGYSSLSLVSEMDFDTLKFDRSFFTNLSDLKAQKIVRCLINMAQELNLGMVIEGIETQDQIDFLKAEKCDVIQGYFYSRPLPEHEFDEWVDKNGHLEDKLSA